MKITLNDDKNIVCALREGIRRKKGYCPCRAEQVDDNICMCREFREQIADESFEGYCHCKLYFKEK